MEAKVYTEEEIWRAAKPGDEFHSIDSESNGYFHFVEAHMDASGWWSGFDNYRSDGLEKHDLTGRDWRETKTSRPKVASDEAKTNAVLLLLHNGLFPSEGAKALGITRAALRKLRAKAVADAKVLIGFDEIVKRVEK